MSGSKALVAGVLPQLPAAQRAHGRRRLRIIAQADKPERWRPQGDRAGSGARPGSSQQSPNRQSSSSRPNGGRGNGGGGRGGGGGGNRRGKTYVSESGMTLRTYVTSDGKEHLGSAIKPRSHRPFPGPPPNSGPPLRILPIGGLGEIGMNCMMAGVRDRYVVIDAGLMFPDFSDLGMQKILPDTAFLAQWRDRIEALIITHGHEDHIGALPWVVPALDPSTPIYASSFVMQLIKKRLSEYNMWDESRFKTFQMRERFQAGPFEVEPVRVTHSIPDCCGLIMRSSEGTLVHTGDWKIDEQPMDGMKFDRELFQALGSEPVALMMSDSTNVLSPGRTASEQIVHDSIVDKVLAHNGKGRVMVTQFASNLHRLYGVKRAADASGRKICFVGASLSHYLEAAWQDGRAPFEPKELMSPDQLPHANPNEVLIVTTGSQGEPKAQLSLAARDQSNMLKILPDDLLLYSAKVIPGNEGKVTKLLNALASQGVRVRQSRADNLHTSGHAYQEELVELLQSVRPQHFLPVHGEYAFLTEHALLARERAGVNFVDVIRNGEMLAVRERRNRNTVSTGSMAAAEAAARRGGQGLEDDPFVSMIKFDGEEPTYFFNDGGKGTGTAQEMEIEVRTTMAIEGVVVLALDVVRASGGEFGLAAGVRVTTRGIWTDEGRLLAEIKAAVEDAAGRMFGKASLAEVERVAIDITKRRCLAFNGKRPEVIAVAYEHDPRDAHVAAVAEARAASQQAAAGGGDGAGAGAGLNRPLRPKPWEAGAAGSSVRPAAAAGSGGGTLVPGVRRSRLPVPSAAPAAAPSSSELQAPPPPPAHTPERQGRPAAAAAAAQADDEDEDSVVIPVAGSSDEDEPSASGRTGTIVDEEDVPLAQRLKKRKAAAAQRSRAAAAPAADGDASPATGSRDEGESGGDGAGESALGRMLKTRKAAVATRRTRASDATDDGAAAGPPPLQPLDPRVIQDRRRRNPRDTPSQLEDPDYG